MIRRSQGFWAYLTIGAMLLTGCHPTQPFFFFEDGDLSHYMDVATDIEYPDVSEPSLDSVTHTMAPLTLENADNIEFRDISLEDAIRITLENSKVMRPLGGVVTNPSRPEAITRQIANTAGVTTVYDPAIVESGYGGATGSPLSGVGVETALSEFDAVLDSSVTWQKNNRPQNANAGLGSFLRTESDQDLANFTLGVTKATAYGSELFARNNTIYDANNSPTRALWSDWLTDFELGFRQPLLQGRGTQYNRIAGPHSFASYAAGNPNSFDGVVIARIRHDLTLADFEAGVRDLVEDVEEEYWDLLCAYRRLETAKIGLQSSRESWVTANERKTAGTGSEADEAQAAGQYTAFRSQAETALTELFRAENRLRYSMGLAMSDGQLLRPSDEPTTARVHFDWAEIQCEALTRRVEIRKKKWEVKRRELELIAARNHLLPRLDATATYRWLGLGDDLIDENRTGLTELMAGSNAFESLTRGNYQEWEIGLLLNVPIGFRAQMSGVRHHQLLLARERALLKNTELEITYQLGDSIRDADNYYQGLQTNFNRLAHVEREVASLAALVEAGTVEGALDRLLEAQRRRADAADTYYRALCDYNRAIMRIHREKGTLLEYNGVYLAEGPWTGKAYFDALRRARQRDASMYLDYGFTRPNVMSRGPIQSHGGARFDPQGDMMHEGATLHEGEEYYGPSNSEIIPTPASDGGALQYSPGSESLPGRGAAAARRAGGRQFSQQTYRPSGRTARGRAAYPGPRLAAPDGKSVLSGSSAGREVSTEPSRQSTRHPTSVSRASAAASESQLDNESDAYYSIGETSGAAPERMWSQRNVPGAGVRR